MTTQEKIDALTAFLDTVRILRAEAAAAGRWPEVRMHERDMRSLIFRRAVLKRRLRAEQTQTPTL